MSCAAAVLTVSREHLREEHCQDSCQIQVDQSNVSAETNTNLGDTLHTWHKAKQVANLEFEIDPPWIQLSDHRQRIPRMNRSIGNWAIA